MIAGGGFSLMAWELAQRRIRRVYPWQKPSRSNAKWEGTVSHEHYRILDAATKGFDVQQSERARGMCMSPDWIL